ncbi:MAG TPA: hypothetical protein ENN14_02275 [Chloroflexi bacterium]|nr:hypothetical protein [Chloroflexota bacterium]
MDLTLEAGMLTVALPAPLPPEAPLELALSFELQIPAVRSLAWPPEGNLGASARLIQAGDWIPTLVPYMPGVGWQRWNYHPVGDPAHYDIANYDVTIHAPAEIVIAAPGTRASTDATTRRYHLERARTFAFLASPDYQRVETVVGTIPVASYYLPAYSAAGRAVLEIAERAILLFEELYGAFPYPELVIAQNAYYGAMEYSALISLTGYGYTYYTGSPRDLLVTLTVHEIAHQWWYGAVGNDQVHEPWLDEAFAKYSELLYYERYHPELVGWWWNSIHAWEPVGSLDNTIYNYRDTRTYIHMIYGQGAYFMDDLRQLMGEAAFWDFIRDYRVQGQDGIMTREDFFTVLRRHTDADLTPLLETYFGAP